MNKIMDALTEAIKCQFQKFCGLYSAADKIEDLSDYYKVTRWMKKVKKLYGAFTVIAILSIVIGLSGGILLFKSLFEVEIPLGILVPLSIPLALLTNWGYASLILHFKDVVRSVFKSATSAYQAGEKIETTHYQVSHEYGNTYRVSSYTENKGCLFAGLAIMARFWLWAFFCVYIAPFLTYKKFQKSKEEVKKFKARSKN